MSEPQGCSHPAESREFEAGNYVPPFGWEIHPGWYCGDCGEMLDPEEIEDGPDPDLLRKAEKEMEQ